jgi:hypothetical protein
LTKRRTPYLSVVGGTDTGNKPFNGQLATRTVRNPYDGTLVEVSASIRDEILGRLYARHHIAHHQFEAGRHLESLFERSAVTPLRAMDFSHEPVDGGRAFADPFNDRQRNAGDKLAEVRAVLGDDDFKLVTLALRDRVKLSQIAQMCGQNDKAVGRRFRGVLEKLAQASGHAGIGPYRREVRDKHTRAAGTVPERLKLAA